MDGCVCAPLAGVPPSRCEQRGRGERAPPQVQLNGIGESLLIMDMVVQRAA